MTHELDLAFGDIPPYVNSTYHSALLLLLLAPNLDSGMLLAVESAWTSGCKVY